MKYNDPQFLEGRQPQPTIRLDEQVIDYFKNMAEETGMPYQNIINYYLLDCVKEKKHLEVAFSK